MRDSIHPARLTRYHTAFHDVTTGSNKLAMPYPAGTAGYHAGPGWDPVTGWGTPTPKCWSPSWPAEAAAGSLAA
jgi:hypothetical protein